MKLNHLIKFNCSKSNNYILSCHVGCGMLGIESQQVPPYKFLSWIKLILVPCAGLSVFHGWCWCQPKMRSSKSLLTFSLSLWNLALGNGIQEASELGIPRYRNFSAPRKKICAFGSLLLWIKVVAFFHCLPGKSSEVLFQNFDGFLWFSWWLQNTD